MIPFKIYDLDGCFTCVECGHSVRKDAIKCSNENCRTNTPTELVPCLFCGACNVHDDLIGSPPSMVWVVYCPTCGARGPFGKTRDEARKLWASKEVGG